ncbi:MAG TPA: pyrroloquinoline quinone-dependent dehydrogenase, partial [Acidobacteria bacterium]|nr:pyrroloquinoline quinone-dependent dehydrogenase [Acidobacteriota bacterium]
MALEMQTKVARRIPRADCGTLAALATLMALVVVPAATAGQLGADGAEWRSYGGDAGSTKYSPLAQITPENVDDLAVAWRWVSVDGRFDLDALRAQYPALRVANDTGNVSINGLKGTPLMVGDTLYLSTPLSQVAAIDAATGETRWVYDPQSYAAGIPIMVLGFSSRGLAYWTDGEQARIVWATGDARLHAVDARTGEVVSEFGDGGSVDLMRGIPGARRDPPPINYSVTSPPVVCNDIIIVGSAVSDQPRFKESPPGHVRGFDARTGALRWTFHTVPQPGEFGHDTWEDGSADYTGNANVWTMMSADPELGYAYLPVGNATNDHYGGHRPGTNLFSNSLVCVECSTGERVWHFQ